MQSMNLKSRAAMIPKMNRRQTIAKHRRKSPATDSNNPVTGLEFAEDHKCEMLQENRFFNFRT